MTCTKFLTSLIAAVLFGMPAMAEVHGFRANYSNANPPTEWSVNKNILWNSILPGDGGHSHPIVLDERLYLTVEPDRLLCIDAETGKRLWEEQNGIHTILSRSELNRIMDTVLELREDAEKRRGLKEELKKAKHDKWWAGRQKKQDRVDMFQKQIDKITAQIETLDEQLKDYDAIKPSSSEDVGFTSPTPVTDGERIYAIYGSGGIVAYTPDGERAWAKFDGPARLEGGHRASPILAGGFLITTFDDIVAWDAATGDEIWRTEAVPSPATPLVLPLKEGEQIITGSGLRLTVADGTVLPGKLPASIGAPVADGNKVYILGEKDLYAYKVPSAPEAKPELLWRVGNGSRKPVLGPVLHEDILYITDSFRGIKIKAFDAATGELVPDKGIGLPSGREGGLAGPPAVVEGRWYIAIRGDHRSAGKIHVYQTGNVEEKLAVNTTRGPIPCAPVFVDSRIYIQSGGTLYCVKEKATE